MGPERRARVVTLLESFRLVGVNAAERNTIHAEARRKQRGQIARELHDSILGGSILGAILRRRVLMQIARRTSETVSGSDAVHPARLSSRR